MSTLAMRRLDVLVRAELRLLWKFRVPVAVAAVTALWVVVLRLVPPDLRSALVPVALLIDIAALGFLFLPALLVLERANGVEAALRVTPVRIGERLGARVGVATTFSLLAGLIIATAAGVDRVPVVLLGVVTTSVLFGLIAVVLIGHSTDLTSLVVRAPLAVAPLLVPAVLRLAGAVDSPLLALSPVTSAVDLLRGRLSPIGLVWQVAWIATAAALATHNAAPSAAGVRRRRRRPPGGGLRHPGRYTHRMAIRSYLRVDRAALVRDALPLMLVGGVAVVAVVARIIGSVGVAWADRRYGIDLVPHLPLVWALLLVIHTPVMFGTITGLLLLEERDANLLGALATTRASLPTLIAYRLGATALVTAVVLMVVLPVANVIHPAGPVGTAAVVVAAVALSLVPALLMAAFATNRVEGVGVMKVIGLPLYLPLLTWFLDGDVRWLFAPLPSWWVARTLWTPDPAGALAFAAGAVVLSSLVAAPLCKRLLGTVRT
ncbi:MAG: hypothetical protein ACRDZO_12560 [Egibacteraceae bacterium]